MIKITIEEVVEGKEGKTTRPEVKLELSEDERNSAEKDNWAANYDGKTTLIVFHHGFQVATISLLVEGKPVILRTYKSAEGKTGKTYSILVVGGERVVILLEELNDLIEYAIGALMEEVSSDIATKDTVVEILRKWWQRFHPGPKNLAERITHEG